MVWYNLINSGKCFRMWCAVFSVFMIQHAGYNEHVIINTDVNGIGHDGLIYMFIHLAKVTADVA